MVAKQCVIIARLEEDGYRAVGALRTLDLFARTFAIFEDHYLDILNEIAEPKDTQRWCRPPQQRSLFAALKNPEVALPAIRFGKVPRSERPARVGPFPTQGDPR
jgi:hypothetical protein